jgi:hypothetical protein
MKLWVDDIRPAPDETWTVARTITSAFNALQIRDAEVVSLDHDISHQVSIGTGLERPFPCPENFTPVAHYIGLDHCAKKIILHTSNPVGAENMKAILMHYGYEEEQIEVRPMGAANRLEMEV